MHTGKSLSQSCSLKLSTTFISCHGSIVSTDSAQIPHLIPDHFMLSRKSYTSPLPLRLTDRNPFLHTPLQTAEIPPTPFLFQ